MVGVALDDQPDDVRPWVEGITFPVLIDPEHLLTELYAISNVPTVIWIDEDDRIVRPNGVAFGTDMFKDFTGVEAGPHMELVREWVRDGELRYHIHTFEGLESAPDALNAMFTGENTGKIVVKL